MTQSLSPAPEIKLPSPADDRAETDRIEQEKLIIFLDSGVPEESIRDYFDWDMAAFDRALASVNSAAMA